MKGGNNARYRKNRYSNANYCNGRMSPYNAYTGQFKHNDSGDYTIILHGLLDIANT